jgi:hypothetical protein
MPLSSHESGGLVRCASFDAYDVKVKLYVVLGMVGNLILRQANLYLMKR